MSKNYSTTGCSKIVGIQFSIMSPEEIRKGSVAEITSRDTYVNNKPVIAYRPPPHTLWNTAHLEILGDGGLYFKDEEQFKNILSNFKPKDYKDLDNNFYKDYTPEKVMEIFKRVFIDGSNNK